MKKKKFLPLLAFLCIMITSCGASRYHDPELTAAADSDLSQEAFSDTYRDEAESNTAPQPSEPGEIPALTPHPEPSEEASEPSPPDSVDILIAGDVLFSDHVLNAYNSAGGTVSGILDEGYQSLIADADFFVVNEEFPFSSRGTAAPDKQFTFRLPEDKVSIMKELGVDLVTLANNHSLDFGTDALLDTCAVLDEAGILHVGAGENADAARKPAIVEAGGIRIGFIGASRVIPVASWTAGKNSPGLLTAYDTSLLLQTIQETRPLCDYLIVYPHWGVERAEMPVEHQTSIARQCIDAGADFVVGSHPHVLQGLEYYRDKPIAYSMGNFIFGSSIPKTMLLKLTLDTDSLTPSISLIPGTSSGGYTRQLTDEASVRSFYQYMESISFGISIDESGLVSPAA